MPFDLCWKSDFASLASRFGPLAAVADDEGAYSYDDLFEAAAGIACRLIDLGANEGATVAYRLGNCRGAVAASYGIGLTGAAEAPINPALSTDDARHCTEAVGASIVVTDEAGARELAGGAATVVDIGAITLRGLAELPARRSAADAWGKIIFTSGTTGRPKAIVHSQRGRWLANLLMRATLPRAPSPGERLLLLAPFAHGASLMTYAFLDGGATVELPRKIEPLHVAERLASGEIGSLMASPTVLAKLADVLEGSAVDSVRAIYCGTAPLSRALYDRVRRIFGPVVRIAYGQSEIFNPIATLRPEETDRWYEEGGEPGACCVGWPASGVEIRIGAGDQAGGVGPVMVRSPHMLAGKLVERIFEPHPPGGFLRTGDVGYIDARGRLLLCGREADMMKSGGYRVSPEEVEALLRPHVARGEIAAFGLPSEHWGEIVAVAATGVDEDWAGRLPIGEITAYKRPRLFVVLPELPVNALGKVVRSRLLEMTLERYRLADGPYPVLEPLGPD